MFSIKGKNRPRKRRNIDDRKLDIIKILKKLFYQNIENGSGDNHSKKEYNSLDVAATLSFRCVSV